MYRLMIVDDDEIIREGLVKNIKWNENGIQVVAEAKNGKEALEKIELFAPEIILSDIKMPFMDGIELSKYLYEHSPQIKILLLSAYEEFEYAKKALQYHVSDYIMKYESNDMILDRVKQLITQYEIDKKHKDIIDKNKDYLLKDFIQQLCFNQLEENEIEKKIVDINNEYKTGLFSVLSFAIETYNSKRETRIVTFSNDLKIIDHINEFFKQNGCLTIVFQDKENIKFVINHKEKDEFSVDDFQKKLELLVYEIESSNPINMQIGGGNFYLRLEDIYKSYMEAEQALSTVKLIERGRKGSRVILYGSTKNKHENMADTMDKIVQYINEHFSDTDLSLNTIAKQVYLSPNYISTLFKKYLDVNISNYIIDIRMKKAEKLLRESDYKAYEIANMVGYTNSQYFSILFKRSIGISPTDYRSQNL